jgi:hypothetical protein
MRRVDLTARLAELLVKINAQVSLLILPPIEIDMEFGI